MTTLAVQDSISLLAQRLLAVLNRTAKETHGQPSNIDIFCKLLMRGAEHREELLPALASALEALAETSYMTRIPLIEAYCVISTEGSAERAKAVKLLEVELAGEYGHGRVSAAIVAVERGIQSLRQKAERVLLAIATDATEPAHLKAANYGRKLGIVAPLTPEAYFARLKRKDRDFLSDRFDSIAYLQEVGLDKFDVRQFLAILGAIQPEQAAKLFGMRAFTRVEDKIDAALIVYTNAETGEQAEAICRLIGEDLDTLPVIASRCTQSCYIEDVPSRFYIRSMGMVQTSELVPYVPDFLRFMLYGGECRLVDHAQLLAALLGGQDEANVMLECILEFFDGSPLPSEGYVYDIIDELLPRCQGIE